MLDSSLRVATDRRALYNDQQSVAGRHEGFGATGRRPGGRNHRGSRAAPEKRAWRCASRTAGGRPGGEGDVLSLLPRLGRSARRHARAARRRLRTSSSRPPRCGWPGMARFLCRLAEAFVDAVSRWAACMRCVPHRFACRRPVPEKDDPVRRLAAIIRAGREAGGSPRWMRSDGTADLRRHPRDRPTPSRKAGSRRAMAAMHRVREGLGSRGRMNAVAGRRAGDRRYARHRRLIARLLRSEGTGKILARMPKRPRPGLAPIRRGRRRSHAAETLFPPWPASTTSSSPPARRAAATSGKPGQGNRLPGVVDTLSAARHAGFEGRFLYLNSIGITRRSLAGTLINLLKKNTLLWRRRVEDHSRASAWITDHPRGFPSSTARRRTAVVVGQGARPLRFRLAARAPTWRKRSSRRCATGRLRTTLEIVWAGSAARKLEPHAGTS